MLFFDKIFNPHFQCIRIQKNCQIFCKKVGMHFKYSVKISKCFFFSTKPKSFKAKQGKHRNLHI